MPVLSGLHCRTALAAALIVLAAPPATAHPHVWITAKVNVIFDAEGRFAAIGEEWLFDYDYTEVVRVKHDADKNGRLDEAELAAAEQNERSWIGTANYFTRVTLAGRVVEHGDPEDFALDVVAGRAKVTFTLPLEEVVAATAAGVDVYDPEFYYDIELALRPITSTDAPASCVVAKREQPNIDPVAVMLIRRLGLTADPAVLADPASGYAVRVAIDCT